ncbi:unnamed protein product [Albugo candida]|uniref:Fibronectin type-III domain-containing protein n=1 Tax=Albugo candida TaxID=65357 RepID=A0A024GVH0_9STRA|nr:unnamed protein product [Albugo candida]|eukprot:CCI50842.1 unnamed protein product [Albugo candida]
MCGGSLSDVSCVKNVRDRIELTQTIVYTTEVIKDQAVSLQHQNMMISVAAVSAHGFESDFTIAVLPRTEPQSPSPPNAVVTIPCAADAILVGWKVSTYRGGVDGDLLQYLIQWDVSMNFDLQSVQTGSRILHETDSTAIVTESVDAIVAENIFETLIVGLEASKRYYARVFGINSVGYSKPLADTIAGGKRLPAYRLVITRPYRLGRFPSARKPRCFSRREWIYQASVVS